jgi:hypothetical protein
MCPSLRTGCQPAPARLATVLSVTAPVPAFALASPVVCRAHTCEEQQKHPAEEHARLCSGHCVLVSAGVRRRDLFCCSLLTWDPRQWYCSCAFLHPHSSLHATSLGCVCRKWLRRRLPHSQQATPHIAGPLCPSLLLRNHDCPARTRTHRNAFAFGENPSGPTNPFIGTGDFALSATTDTTAGDSSWALFLFHWAFSAAAATIMAGAIAERMTMGVYLGYTCMMTTLVSFGGGGQSRLRPAPGMCVLV